jgi:hypothetical protein
MEGSLYIVYKMHRVVAEDIQGGKFVYCIQNCILYTKCIRAFAEDIQRGKFAYCIQNVRLRSDCCFLDGVHR